MTQLMHRIVITKFWGGLLHRNGKLIKKKLVCCYNKNPNYVALALGLSGWQRL